MKNIDLVALLALGAAGYWVLKNEGVITGQYPDSPYPRPNRDLRISGTSYTGTYPRPGRDLRIADDLNYPYVSVDPRRRHQFEITGPITYGQRPPPLEAFPSEAARSSSPNQWPENMDVIPPNYGAGWFITSF